MVSKKRSNAFEYNKLPSEMVKAIHAELRKHDPDKFFENSGSFSIITDVVADVHAALSKLLPPEKVAMDENPGAPINMAWFMKWAGAYMQETRFFHNLGHLHHMTRSPKNVFKELKRVLDLQDDEVKRLKLLNILAGFYHDVEYVHVDGKLTVNSKTIVEKYITWNEEKRSWFVKEEFNENKELIEMVLQVFGNEKGSQLSPFSGMNELLSAMEAAINLREEKGLPDKDILHVVAAIQATIPFKGKERMNELSKRVKKAGKLLNPPLEDRDIDMIVGSSTILANQDVMGMTGGLEPGAEVMAKHIGNVLKGTGELHAEEVPTLRTKIAGNWKVNELPKAILKQYTLFGWMLTDEFTWPSPDGQKAEVFHYATFLTNKQSFPPKEEVQEREDIVKKEIRPAMALALAARLAATRVIAGLANEQGKDKKNIKDILEDRLPKVEEAIKEALEMHPDLLNKKTPTEKMVFDLLFNKRDLGESTYDTDRSLTAAYLLLMMGEKGIKDLAPVVKNTDINDPERKAINTGDHTKFMAERFKPLVADGKIDDLGSMVFKTNIPAPDLTYAGNIFPNTGEPWASRATTASAGWNPSQTV